MKESTSKQPSNEIEEKKGGEKKGEESLKSSFSDNKLKIRKKSPEKPLLGKRLSQNSVIKLFGETATNVVMASEVANFKAGYHCKLPPCTDHPET